jgi:outer membrane immunogenic protein
VWCPRNSISDGTGYNWVQGFRDSVHAHPAEGFKMKKVLLALTAVAAFSGSALAADLAPRTYTKAPPMAVAPSWTGFYIFGGGGGGIWDADSNVVTNPGGVALTNSQRMGGDGWFGTVGAGYDWQFNGSWVAGIFADGQFGSLRGSINDNFNGLTGTEKLRDTWAVGARVGYLVAPNVYSYVNGGYTGSEWSSASLAPTVGGAALVTTPSFNREGWFVGGGVENSLNIFGITSPGWFMKTEYRGAYFDRVTLPETFVGGGASGFSTTFKPFVQTISTSLVYRFNWGGPVVAKY